MQLHSDVSERTVFANYKQTVHLYTKRIAHSHRLLYYCCVNRRSRSIGYASLKLNFGVKNHPQLSSILFAINSIELQLFRSKAIPALRVQQRKKWKMNRVGKRQLNASGSLSTLLCRCVFFFSSFLLRSSNRILFTAQADAKMDTVLCTCTRKQWGSDDDGKRECTIAQSQMRCNKIKWHQKCINSSGAAANIALNVCVCSTPAIMTWTDEKKFWRAQWDRRRRSVGRLSRKQWYDSAAVQLLHANGGGGDDHAKNNKRNNTRLNDESGILNCI